MAVTISGSDGISGDLPTIKVGNGSESAPAVTGQDTDTGLFFGTNEIKMSTGGTEAVTVDSSQNVGIGTSSPVYAVHVERAAPYIRSKNTSAPTDEKTWDFNAGTDGTLRFRNTNDAGSSSNNWLEVERNAVQTNSIKFATGSGTQRMSIDSTGLVTINSGYLTLNGNQVGGIQVTIADNAFATITPPRIGGHWIFVSCAGDSAFPNNNASGFACVDFGNSPNIKSSTLNSQIEVRSDGPPTGTTGSDAHLTLFAGGTSGRIYLENRLGTAYNFQITFL